MPEEREFKFEASPHFDRPDLDGVSEGVSAGEPLTSRLATAYWDTPDLRLARWGCSLRHRVGEGWTVKLPASMDGQAMVRDEHAFAGPGSTPPTAALDLLRAFVRSSQLAPVARLHTRRVSVSLRGDDGTELAEVDDDEVSVLDGGRIAARFRQLEVEVKCASANGLIENVVSRLRAAGAAPDPTPKHLRALGPRADALPEIDPTPPGPDASAGAAVRYAIGASVSRLLRHDAAVRLGADTESVHQARVATRRLRSDLRTFATLFEPDYIGAMRSELAWLGETLGRVRDADVLRTRLQVRLRDRGGDPGEGRLLIVRLTSRRAAARLRMMQALRSQRYVQLLNALVNAAEAPPLSEVADQPAAQVLPRITAQTWQTLRKAVARLDDDPGANELHAVRIAAKECRYASEAAAPIVGKPARRFSAAVAGLQQKLGDYNDAVISTEWLRQAAGEMEPATAFVAGALSESERALAGKARSQWPRAWKKLNRKKTRAWLNRA